MVPHDVTLGGQQLQYFLEEQPAASLSVCYGRSAAHSVLILSQVHLALIYWIVKYWFFTTLLHMNCNCKNLQLLVGEETIHLACNSW